MNPSTTTGSAAPGFKFWAGIVAAVLTYLATQELLDLPTWGDVAINAAGVGLAVYLAAPQPTYSTLHADDPEAGYGLVEVAFALLLVIVALILLTRFL